MRPLAYAGQWHWDDVRASLDACAAYLPRSRFRGALEVADSRRHDSCVVWRWGLALGELHELADPCAYADALTDSAAIHRPSLATRELRAMGELEPPTPEERGRWRDFRTKARVAAGLPFDDEEEGRHGR